ncbi:MAG TPA: coenzyme F420-0:L-glutamate ligase [Candidatus Hydrogenedentes bacterium]|nr:coenzyme F420-0:L-glutamate ligase [Candidatus Hydrogenedentota bacterium]HPJ99630.1 coenzyme F420-0:L-glutamate ligase [Candidatus Hydrogenedentota bacterium]
MPAKGGARPAGRYVGTVARGIRAPIVCRGDAIAEMVVDSVLKASQAEGFSIRDRDVVGITESIVARAQGNYATVDAIAADLRAKFGGESLGIVFPILSRNRYAVQLKGMARSAKRVVLQLSYPSDEVGNQLMEPDWLDEHGIDPWTDSLTEDQFRQEFGTACHPFTGVDYVAYYRSLVEAEGAECVILFSNRPETILAYTRNVLACDIHSRARTKRLLTAAGAERVYGLDDILASPIGDSGYHPEYGLLGSNKATEETVKLFPRDCQVVVDRIQELFRERLDKTVEVLVYGDGAFKDPVGKIWELADPVVSPAFTPGLVGRPSELKLKYLADNQFAGLTGEALQQAIAQQVREKKGDLVGAMEAQGTTPRRLTDLIGSLCDLTSGSGDKGTPIVHIQGYFDNFAED